MAPTVIDESNPYKKEYTNKRKKPNETESDSEICQQSATKKQDTILSEEKKSKIFAKKPEIDEVPVTLEPKNFSTTNEFDPDYPEEMIEEQKSLKTPSN